MTAPRLRAKRYPLYVVGVLFGVAPSAVAFADDPPPAISLETPAASASTSSENFLPEAPPEAPPPLPHKKGVVLESSLGALGFAGQFRHVAPMGPLMRLTLG